LYALHLDEWRFLLVKGYFFENLKKNQFLGVGRTVRALGADGPRVFDIYLISEVFGKSFRENALPGGQSACPMWTVRYSPRNLTAQGATRWTARTVRVLLADSPQGPGEWSTVSWRTVRLAQQLVLPAVDFAFLPLEFKRGQSARASQTVCEVRVLPITASNGEGSINTPSPGLESPSWHFERSILPCRALPPISLTHLA
jgi:hypothetical protein